ncbi:carbohydrate kinase [Haloarculaceae archaeon H-GB2-1]|nr:carbohydrate kinase [Haloarculaceae archaeon H-GB1-1]MEA5386589.1 carbohydrate kinase [Haloarculaceae archaeon H-GB11]MEA5408108.1 carbohydrate kinase [Haloarculaceae archaeon H-GB2-1]
MSRNVLVAGETLVDFIPDRAGPLTDVESFTRRAGGAPANVAVGLSRLDETPWFCTALATDPFGEYLSSVLAGEGLPDRFVTTHDECTTALAFVSHDADADRGFTFYRDETADVQLDTASIPDETLADVEYVVVGGVSLTVEPSRTATFDLVDRARTHDCTVVFDPNDRPELWDDAVDPSATLERMLERVDVVKATADDVASLDVEDDDIAESLLAFGPHTVFLTHGSAGSTAESTAAAPWGAGEWSHPGFDVEPVDTTGAGDAFTAGVVAALVDGRPPVEVLRFANAVAAETTTSPGAMTALPNRDALEDVLR